MDNIKRPNQMSPTQKELYELLSDTLEDWADKHKLNRPEGVKQIFEVLVTLTLAIKALYFIRKDKDNEIPAPIRSTDTEFSNDASD